MKKRILYFLVVTFFSAKVPGQCYLHTTPRYLSQCVPVEVKLDIISTNTGNAVWTCGKDTAKGLSTAINILLAGTHTINCTYTNPTCTATASLVLTFYTWPDQGCGKTTTGLSEFFTNSDLGIYPNPNKGIFNILLTNEIENVHVVLTKLTGQAVFETVIASEAPALDCSFLPPGIYFLHVSTNNRRISSKKLIIE